MKNTNTTFKKNISRGVVGLAVAAGISLVGGAAFAQDETSMAPPVESSAPAGFGGNETNAAADSVFNWKEIPADQQVPLTRASFDQGGYQLYDAVGETIVVPFTSENLYVMKFAASPNGRLYFENEGGYPVLYVPKGGYLENATVSGARWYPFGQDFHPAEPVFLGIAPSYDAFINLGWYADTRYYGGYYGNTSFISGGLFLPTIGLFFSIGGHDYYGWNDYHRYYEGHPGYYRTDYYNRDFYHYAGSHYNRFAPDRRFQGDAGGFDHGNARGFNQGANHGYADHALSAGHSNFAGRPSFGGRSDFGGRPNFGGNSGDSGRTFRGSSSYGNGSHNNDGNHSYSVNNYGGGGRTFGGGQNAGGQNYGGGQSYNGGSHSYSGGQSYGGNGGSFGGGHENSSRQNYTSQNSGGGRQSFGGGNRGGFSGGSQSTRSVSSGGGSRGGNSSGGNQGGGNRGGGGRGR